MLTQSARRIVRVLSQCQRSNRKGHGDAVI